MTPAVPDLSHLQQQWQASWDAALHLWSPYLQLSAPRWCSSPQHCQDEGLTGSIAMIRLVDHAVVIDLAGVVEHQLSDFPLEILGHEIGHHVFCPGDLTDQMRLLARVRRGLPTLEPQAPLIANLYADLLINDHLQRNAQRDMAGVYRKLGGAEGQLWALYLRIYEILWRLPRESLTARPLADELDADAHLGARHIRIYARDWLRGAKGFAFLCLPYLRADLDAGALAIPSIWADTAAAGAGGEPDGLTTLDDDEDGEPVHPADDPKVVGEAPDNGSTGQGREKSPAEQGGGKSRKAKFREPADYGELLRQAGVKLDDREAAMRYYRERARPYLIRFPQRQAAPSTEPLAEGLELWEIGDPLADIDWVETVTHNPQVIPGLTTRQRHWGSVPGNDPTPVPMNLYLGIDCSGSMPNPASTVSYPVLAGTIIALSALRAGARVMACLSGEPGRSIATEGLIRSESDILRLLVQYLGTGYSYGIHRLADLAEHLTPQGAPTHILLLTDTDLFYSLEDNGWSVAEQVLRLARGGGTVVMNCQPAHLKSHQQQADRLQQQGWTIKLVARWPEVLQFAAEFSRKAYGQAGP